jgi:hypothetical protein
MVYVILGCRIYAVVIYAAVVTLPIVNGDTVVVPTDFVDVFVDDVTVVAPTNYVDGEVVFVVAGAVVTVTVVVPTVILLIMMKFKKLLYMLLV